LPVLLVKEQQRSETRDAQEGQLTDIEYQRRLEPCEAADCLGDEICVGHVDFAFDTQNGGQLARVDMHLRTGAIDYIAAAWFAEPVG
jgi:hypothetical protein